MAGIARRVLRRAQRAAGAARGSARDLTTRAIQVAGTKPSRSDVMTHALVEAFERRQILGWVAADPDGPPVRVAVYLNDIEAAGTWAVDPIERDGPGDFRAFRLGIFDLWSYARRSDKISVRVDGQPVPIVGRGLYFHPRNSGPESPEALQAKLAEGYVFGQTGRLQLPKGADVEWQATVLRLYNHLRDVLRESFDYDPFLIYGSLLGAVREKGFIGHDLDFDCAYVSRHRDGKTAAKELQKIAFALLDAGFRVECHATALHLTDADSGAVRIDLFHLFFGPDGLLKFPFGVAGTSTISIDEWRGTEEIDFVGSPAAVAVDAEKLVEHIYGATWRTPKPGFNWNRDRTDRAWEGILWQGLIQPVYWADFYSHNRLTAPSPFGALLAARSDLPDRIVDLGCGDGRDAIAFAQAGRQVVGLDYSAAAVDHATERATELGLSDLASFEVVILGRGTRYKRALRDARGRSAEPTLFYARFFLNSLTDEAQDALMAAIADVAAPGDMFAAEFRTDRDETTKKAFGKHFRRFQNGPVFAKALAEQYGFVPFVEQEGNGLSVFEGEDPHLYRVIARRPADPAAGS
jgi:SAM-dependent methyltransferase